MITITHYRHRRASLSGLALWRATTDTPFWWKHDAGYFRGEYPAHYPVPATIDHSFGMYLLSRASWSETDRLKAWAYHYPDRY